MKTFLTILTAILLLSSCEKEETLTSTDAVSQPLEYKIVTEDADLSKIIFQDGRTLNSSSFQYSGDTVVCVGFLKAVQLKTVKIGECSYIYETVLPHLHQVPGGAYQCDGKHYRDKPIWKDSKVKIFVADTLYREKDSYKEIDPCTGDSASQGSYWSFYL